jgi:prepilin-type N-terminal cleavage/methylation domain-containing protein
VRASLHARLLRRSRARARGFPARTEIGMTLVELMVAMSILAIVMSGLALSIGVDYKAVALARARQVAEAAANKRLEELRDVDYATMALSATGRPTHSTDSTNPDYYVTPNSGNGTTYDVTGAGLNEALIIADPGEPGIDHIESPVTIGTTVVDVYQYVTWVDDAAIAGTQNLKRLTVVVQYHSVPTIGQSRLLRESVILTNGNVTLPASGVATTTSSSTSTTTLPATTTTTTASSCGGTFSVGGSSGAANGFTASTTVTLTMTGFSACGGSILVNFSNNGGTTWGSDFSWSATTTTLAWTLATGDGTKTIAARARSGAAGTPWTVPAQSIILDTTAPSAPPSISRTASCSGSTRTVVLSWTSSTDTYLVGYHLYVSSDGTTYSLSASVSGNSKTTTSSKSSPIYYKVKAYDSAGNESSATSVISLAKNQCS